VVPIPVVAIAVLGLLAGSVVDGVASSYHHHGGSGPWPCCRRCGRPRGGVASIPLVGLTMTRRCVACGRPYWVHALATHLATLLAFVAVGAPRVSSWPALGVALCEAAVLVALFFIDLETRTIPTAFVAALVALGLGGAVLGVGPCLGAALLGGIVGFVAFGVLAMVARLRYGDGALGLGDVNLALATGCIVGYPLVALTLAVGVVLGGFGAATVLLCAVVARRRLADSLRSVIPYGPWMIAALFLVMARIITA